MGLGLWFIKEIFLECRSAAKQHAYLELRQDYEEYHEKRVVGHMVLARAERIRGWLKTGGTILDLGCGDGTVAEHIKNKVGKAEIHCRDVSETALRLARQRGFSAAYFDLNRGNVEELPVSDYVLLLDVLEHTVSPHIILPKIAAIARKAVIVSLPNSGRMPFRFQLLGGLFPRQSFSHLHFWTKSDFPYFCEQLGLEVLDTLTDEPPPGRIPRFLYRRFPNAFCEHLYFLLRGKAA